MTGPGPPSSAVTISHVVTQASHTTVTLSPPWRWQVKYECGRTEMDSMCSPPDHVGRSDKTCSHFDVLSERRKQCSQQGGLETGGDLGDSKQHNAGILNYRAGGAGGGTEHRPAARPPPFTPNLRPAAFSQLHFMKMPRLTHCTFVRAAHPIKFSGRMKP